MSEKDGVSEEATEESKSSGEERRDHPRTEVKLPILLSADERTLTQGTIINLSKRGVFLITEVGDVEMGDMVNVKLRLGEGQEGEEGRIIEAQARVVRVEDLSGLALFLSKDLEVEPGEDK